jgi:hypothetical protein
MYLLSRIEQVEKFGSLWVSIYASNDDRDCLRCHYEYGRNFYESSSIYCDEEYIPNGTIDGELYCFFKETAMKLEKEGYVYTHAHLI